jgi:hypothetical protein
VDIVGGEFDLIGGVDMEAVRLHRKVAKDGELRVAGLPFRKGQEVEMILLVGGGAPAKNRLTAAALSGSGLVGIWKDRSDIGDTLQFARRLREQTQKRSV